MPEKHKKRKEERKEGSREGKRREDQIIGKQHLQSFPEKKICITQSNHAKETEDVEGSMQGTSRKFKIHSIIKNGKSLQQLHL